MNLWNGLPFDRIRIFIDSLRPNRSHSDNAPISSYQQRALHEGVSGLEDPKKTLLQLKKKAEVRKAEFKTL